MKDQYTADRRDPVIKQIERQGLIELAASVGAPLETLRELFPERARPCPERVRQRRRRSRLVSGVLLAVWLQPIPAFAIKRESVYDGLRRWEHGAYCQGLFRQNHWYTDYVAYFSGC